MHKPSLNPEEVLRVAYGHIIGLVEQPVLAAIFCVNQGRVAEAAQAIRFTMENHKLVYRVVLGKAKIVDINDNGHDAHQAVEEPQRLVTWEPEESSQQ